jgi:hypothetical protein
MSEDAVRLATADDNPKLIELEHSSPQGMRLQIYSERKDYFFRSTPYGNQHTLRLHPDYRRTVLGRHMLLVWNLMDGWAEESGAALMYGLVKSENTTMIDFQRKKQSYRFN